MLIETVIDKMKKILVIDDEERVRTVTAQLLRQMDFLVVEALNGWEGIKVATKELPDLIISDIQMPVINGFMVCEELKHYSLTEHIPFIFMTGTPSAEYMKHAEMLGVKDVLSKPFALKDLINTINTILSLRLV
jgi:CheY-like chemotaxis protein